MSCENAGSSNSLDNNMKDEIKSNKETEEEGLYSYVSDDDIAELSNKNNRGSSNLSKKANFRKNTSRIEVPSQKIISTNLE